MKNKSRAEKREYLRQYHLENKEKNREYRESHKLIENDRKVVYKTELKRQIVAEFLLAIGWKYSEKGIWFKDKIKDENGNWNFIVNRYKKRWRDKNKEKVKEYSKIWKVENKERCKIINHLYYEKHKDKINSRDRREYMRQYKINHKEELQASKRRWRNKDNGEPI
jgi:hypothetical protein